MDNIYTAALRRAAEAEGSTQALAEALRVPEGTLLRWMSGRAMMPLAAFHRIVDIVVTLEQRGPPPPALPPRHTLTFALREISAHCARCGHAAFLSPMPAEALPYSAVVRCASCGTEARHKDLLAQIARDLRLAVKPPRLMQRAPGIANARKLADGDGAA